MSFISSEKIKGWDGTGLNAWDGGKVDAVRLK